MKNLKFILFLFTSFAFFNIHPMNLKTDDQLSKMNQDALWNEVDRLKEPEFLKLYTKANPQKQADVDSYLEKLSFHLIAQSADQDAVSSISATFKSELANLPSEEQKTIEEEEEEKGPKPEEEGLTQEDQNMLAEVKYLISTIKKLIDSKNITHLHFKGGDHGDIKNYTINIDPELEVVIYELEQIYKELQTKSKPAQNAFNNTVQQIGGYPDINALKEKAIELAEPFIMIMSQNIAFPNKLEKLQELKKIGKITIEAPEELGAPGKKPAPGAKTTIKELSEAQIKALKAAGKPTTPTVTIKPTQKPVEKSMEQTTKSTTTPTIKSLSEAQKEALKKMQKK